MSKKPPFVKLVDFTSYLRNVAFKIWSCNCTFQLHAMEWFRRRVILPANLFLIRVHAWRWYLHVINMIIKIDTPRENRIPFSCDSHVRRKLSVKVSSNTHQQHYITHTRFKLTGRERTQQQSCLMSENSDFVGQVWSNLCLWLSVCFLNVTSVITWWKNYPYPLKCSWPQIEMEMLQVLQSGRVNEN